MMNLNPDDLSSSTIVRLTFEEWMKFGSDIKVKMNRNNVIKSQHHLKTINLSDILLHNKIPAKLMTLMC